MRVCGRCLVECIASAYYLRSVVYDWCHECQIITLWISIIGSNTNKAYVITVVINRSLENGVEAFVGNSLTEGTPRYLSPMAAVRRQREEFQFCGVA